MNDTITSYSEQLIDARNNFGPSTIRDQAKIIFQNHPMPDSKNEIYKYTPLKNLLPKHVDLSDNNPVANIIENLDVFNLPALNGSIIVLVDGKYNEQLSTPGTNENMIISFTDDDTFSDLTQWENDPLASLNAMLFTTCINIEIKKNTAIEEDINIINIQSSIAQNYIRINSTLDENSQATINEFYLNTVDSPVINSLSHSVNIGKKATLTHHKFQTQGSSQLSLNNTFINQKENSTYSLVDLSLSGKLIRNNIVADLDGEYCETNLFGLFIPKNNSHYDNYTVVNHKLPNSNSNELFKGIASEKGSGVFNGRIFVRPGAQNTNAFQANKNIILDDSSKIYAKPQLEIWADDVKCSHGCTTGQLNEESLFYLQSRGLSKESARTLLLHAFTNEVSQKITNQDLREYSEKLIHKRLNNSI